ncbi:phosphotransferase enzyme family protein [Paenibacillus lemnae]|uniref:Phosphotransferase n=1 Tax=Paenibacillus lemnae TaxID=1330551 RepID=A0A848M6P7_PAELE|nr:phosphotransferase [Paenibacillus lemnae]NMO96657.1 phosphotransferase [Paenibacillus lemnae]
MILKQEIQEVLLQYGISDPVITFIRHSENRTYRIEQGGQRYLFRIHQPVEASMKGLQHEPEGLLHELRMLNHLSGQAGQSVQKPIRTREGEWISYISIDNREIPCSLLTWLEGRAVRGKDLKDPALASLLGRQVAGLHQIYRQYAGFPRSERPNQGRSNHLEVARKIRLGESKGLFTHEDLETVDEAVHFINSAIETRFPGEDSPERVHGDIGTSNILLREDGTLSIIDYGFFGSGYELLDIGMGALCVPGDFRGHYLEGYYGGDFPEKDGRLLEGFMLTAVLGYYAFQIHHEQAYDWMKERMLLL